MSGPRLAPRPVAGWPEGLLARTQDILGSEYRASANVYCTLANGPRLFEAWLHLGGQLLRRSTLDPRDRELVILRTTALAAGTYPFTQHVRIGREVGLSADDVDAVLTGPEHPHWDRSDRARLQAVDELMVNGTLDDATWEALTGQHTVQNLLDLLVTVGFYRMASWLLNAAGTELDDGQTSALPTPTPRPGGSVPSWRRASEVRLAPVALDQWPSDLVDETATWPRFVGRPEIRRAGVYETLANHPDLFRAMGPVMAHLLEDHALSDRQRELVIVRACLRDRGEYPYRQHVRIGRELGLDDETLAALASPDPTLSPPVLSDPGDAGLVQLVDQLHDHNTIDDDLWSDVASHHDITGLLDAIVTIGFYGIVSFVLNTAGTRLEPGDVRLPADVRAKMSP